ncbi:MAG: hypothetical protein IT376_08165 [Polyangiaceae bacterium]|nr:hypothetical protein [Polyangiaceae bacterium]
MLVRYIEATALHAATCGLVPVLVWRTIESSFIPFSSEVVMIPAGSLAARGALTLGRPMGDATIAVVAGIAGSLAGA